MEGNLSSDFCFSAVTALSWPILKKSLGPKDCTVSHPVRDGTEPRTQWSCARVERERHPGALRCIPQAWSQKQEGAECACVCAHLCLGVCVCVHAHVCACVCVCLRLGAHMCVWLGWGRATRGRKPAISGVGWSSNPYGPLQRLDGCVRIKWELLWNVLWKLKKWKSK